MKVKWISYMLKKKNSKTTYKNSPLGVEGVAAHPRMWTLTHPSSTQILLFTDIWRSTLKSLLLTGIFLLSVLARLAGLDNGCVYMLIFLSDCFKLWDQNVPFTSALNKKNYWMDLWVALQRDVAHWWHDHAIPHADKPGSPQEFWMGLVGQANQARCVWFSRLLCFSKQTLPLFEIRAGGDKRAKIIFSRDAPPLRHVADMCTKHRQWGKENRVKIWKFDGSINLMWGSAFAWRDFNQITSQRYSTDCRQCLTFSDSDTNQLDFLSRWCLSSSSSSSLQMMSNATFSK